MPEDRQPAAQPVRSGWQIAALTLGIALGIGEGMWLIGTGNAVNTAYGVGVTFGALVTFATMRNGALHRKLVPPFAFLVAVAAALIVAQLVTGWTPSLLPPKK